MVCHMLEWLQSWHAEQRQRCQRCQLASPNFRHGCDRVLRPWQHFDFFEQLLHAVAHSHVVSFLLRLFLTNLQ